MRKFIASHVMSLKTVLSVGMLPTERVHRNDVRQGDTFEAAALRCVHLEVPCTTFHFAESCDPLSSTIGDVRRT